MSIRYTHWGQIALNVSSSLEDALPRPQGIFIHDQKIYWAENGTNYPGEIYDTRSLDGAIKRSDMDGSNVETIKTGLYAVTGIDIGLNPSTAAEGPAGEEILYYAQWNGGPDCGEFYGEVGWVTLNGSDSGYLIRGCNDAGAYMDDPITVHYVKKSDSLPEAATPGIIYTENGTDTAGIQGLWYRCLTASVLTEPTQIWNDSDTSYPGGGSYDSTTNKIYWVTLGTTAGFPIFEDGMIRRGTLDLVNGTVTDIEILIDNLKYPTAFSLDPIKQEMYWSEGPFSITGSAPNYYSCGLENKNIWYAPMDGTGSVAAKLFTGSLNMPIGSFISTTRRLYWSDGCDGTLKSLPLSGSGYYDTTSSLGTTSLPNRI